MKILNKQELEQNALNHLLDIITKDFMYESLQKGYFKTILFFSY